MFSLDGISKATSTRTLFFLVILHGRVTIEVSLNSLLTCLKYRHRYYYDNCYNYYGNDKGSQHSYQKDYHCHYNDKSNNRNDYGTQIKSQ